MKIVIQYEDKVLRSKETPCSPKEFQTLLETLKDTLPKATYYSMELDNGSTLILPKEALQRSVIQIYN